MELILLGIYSFLVWLIFFKFKWLPWNITSQVIVVTIPIIALTILVLFMNIVAPSSHDVRAMNYVIPIAPRVTGQVIEVPIEPSFRRHHPSSASRLRRERIAAIAVAIAR